MALELVKDTPLNRKERGELRNINTPPIGYAHNIPYTAVRTYPTLGAYSVYVRFDREQRVAFWRYYEFNVGDQRRIIQAYMEDIGYASEDSTSLGEIDGCRPDQIANLRQMDYLMFQIREVD
jgi:hypothetical protein